MKNRLFTFLIFMVGIMFADTFRESPEQYWNFSELSSVPSYRESPYPDSKYPGLQDYLVSGVSVNDIPSEFFVYFTLPSTPMPAGGYPGVLLIHGGGGTAYPYYVELWRDHGYAVMALDWYNQRPIATPEKNSETQVARAELPGGKRQLHTVNVANMIIAHSLLRSFEKVNADKTIFVGLSWGSWYGAMLAAVDTRFVGGIEIYCGDVVRSSKNFINGRFHHAIKVPLYWIANTNDQNATPASLQAAFDECARLENKSMVINLSHSHVGFTFPACFRMAEYFLKDGPGLPKLGQLKANDKEISADILSQGKGIIEAILCYTDDPGEISHKRVWKSIPANFDQNRVWAQIPEKTLQCFLSAYDEKTPRQDLCGSSNLLAVEQAEQ